MDIVEDTEIIVAEDIIDAASGTHPQVVRNALSALEKKGFLFRVKRGVYIRCEEPFLPVISDTEKLALSIYSGYIAFASAMQHWGLIEYESFTVFVATKSKSGSRDIGEYRIQAVSMGDKAQGMVFDKGVYVSSLEKTIFDCIYKPGHSGGYQLIVKAIADSKPDWITVSYWFDMFGSQSLKQRGGYILDKAGNAPKWLLKRLKLGSDQKIWLDPSGVRSGRYIREWSVIDNVGV